MKPSLTVIIPAYNEEANLSQAMEDLRLALDGLVEDYELLVVDDASLDNTARIAGEKGKLDGRIKCINNERNRGYGYSYQRGVRASTKEYVGVFNGDNDMYWGSFRDLVKNIGRADIISQYSANPGARTWFRRFLSGGFTWLMNTLFRMDLRYFNGCLIARRDILQSLNLRSQGLTVLAEAKVKLIRRGYSYMEIPFTHVPRRGGRSTALSFKSLKASFAAVALMYKDVYWSK